MLPCSPLDFVYMLHCIKTYIIEDTTYSKLNVMGVSHLPWMHLLQMRQGCGGSVIASACVAL
jgi:hypothetical protein